MRQNRLLFEKLVPKNGIQMKSLTGRMSIITQYL